MFLTTIQIYSEEGWIDAFRVKFDSPAKGFSGACTLIYDQDYLARHLDDLGSCLSPAVSVRTPLSWDVARIKNAPSFLYDIAPAGAARRLLAPFAVEDRSKGMSDDLFLLQRFTASPIGHMRVKESQREGVTDSGPGLSRKAIASRHESVAEYSMKNGLSLSGATGAGGESPKALIAEDGEGNLYPDAALVDERVSRHWLVKFPKGKSTIRDKEILRSEYCYYKAISDIGLSTVCVNGLSLEGGDNPSLWMPRFDRLVNAGEALPVSRLAVESIYSAAGVVRPGSQMDHEVVIRMLAHLWTENGQASQVTDLVSEYLRRDLLNRILGNSDNHGRNTSIIKGRKTLQLAPIYDLAPMAMDDEGIMRSTKWGRGLESGGRVNWVGVCRMLKDIADEDELIERLRGDARLFTGLPDRLRDLGLPEVTFGHPAVHLRNLDGSLKQWGLLS